MKRARRLVALAAVAAGVVVACALLLWSRAPESPSGPVGAVQDTDPTRAETTDTVARRPFTSGEPEVPAVWQSVDSTSVAELPPHWEVVENRALVRVSSGAGLWRVGDRIAIAVPQLGTTYASTINEIVAGPGGARSFLGVLVEGTPGRFVITIGRGSVFAFVPTPEGTYELVANGELGWLMPSANMDTDVDYSIPDYHIPNDDDAT